MTAEGLPSYVVRLDTGLDDLSETAADIGEVVAAGGIVWLRLEPATPEANVERLLGEVGVPYVPVSMPTELGRDSQTLLDVQTGGPHARNWHFDQSFAASPPTVSALYAQAIGANAAPTVFCDGAALYAALSGGLQDFLMTTTATHRAYYPIEGQNVEDATVSASHPCAQVVAGDVPAVFVAPGTVNSFDAWTRRDSEPLLAHIWERLNWPEFGYVHRWRAGDLLIWPNLRYPHRALATVASSPRRLVRFLAVMR